MRVARRFFVLPSLSHQTLLSIPPSLLPSFLPSFSFLPRNSPITGLRLYQNGLRGDLAAALGPLSRLQSGGLARMAELNLASNALVGDLGAPANARALQALHTLQASRSGAFLNG